MRRFYDYLLTSLLLRQARFLLPSLFLMILIAFSNTTSVFGQSTEEVCRETEKVLLQLERESEELNRKERLKEKEELMRDNLSILNKAISNGNLIHTTKLEELSEFLNVEFPKDSNGDEKDPEQLTPQEISSFQRTVRSVLTRKLEEAVNTPWDRLKDRIEKNDAQRKLREDRMKALNCEQLLKEGTDESRETPDISGTWKYGTEWTYTITQTGSTFTWSLTKNSENAKGTIKGKNVSATWTNSKGGGSATGTVTQVDGNGRAMRIEWSNGAVFTRD